jgi:opacity protein-like surface antigen
MGGMEMKRLFSVAVLASAVASPAIGSASPSGPYFSGNVGAVILTDSTLSDNLGAFNIEFSDGFGVNGALGYEVGMSRFEVEIGYRSNDVNRFSDYWARYDSGDMTSTSIMFNGYLDFKNLSRMTPFLGAGLGVAFVGAEDVGVDGYWFGDADDTVFAYQFIGGLGYALAPNTCFDISYRYFATSDIDLDGFDADYESHNFMIGVRYAF